MVIHKGPLLSVPTNLLTMKPLLLLFSLFVHVLGDSTNFTEYTSIYSIIPEGPSPNCTLLKDAFSNASSSFMACAVNNSKPITLCENCVDPYIQVLESYNEMSLFSDNGTKCIDHFVDLDRLQIVRTLYENIYNLWNRAKCYECYETVNGSVTRNRSTETVTFNRYYDNLVNCRNRSDVNDTTLCRICIEDYTTLNEYYISISNENERIGVCMDIVDLMNNTRSFWSQRCCRFRKHKEYVFVISTILVLLVPVLFFGLAQMCSEKRFPTILRQRRFAESLHQSNSQS